MLSSVRKIMPQLNGVKNATSKIKEQARQMGTSFKMGLGHVLKYAGALFSLRSIYSALRNSASAWLSSQNAGAKQLSANIEYMKYAMRKCFSTSNSIYNQFSISIDESVTKCSICF